MALNQSKIIKTAEKYLRQGKIDAAIAEYQRLVKANPNDVNTINKIGDLYARHGKAREAIVQFTKIAEFYTNDGFFLKAIAIYKKINKLDPSYMEAYQKLAELYSQQGLVMEAKSQYQAVAEHYMKAGKFDKTRQVYEQVLKLAPDDLKTRLALADIWAKENKGDQAIKEYLAIGQDLDRRDMLKESVRIYQTALKIDPKNREVLDRLIRALGQQGEHDKVIKLLEDEVKSSRDPGLMALLAQAYLGKDRLDDAKKLLEKASSIDSESVDIRVALGRLQLKQGEVAAAYESLEGASEQLEQQKKLTEASHLWEEFIREQSAHAEALTKLEDLYRRNEHPAKANATASDLVDALIAKSRTDEARQVLSRLVECDGGNPRHRERLESLEQQSLSPAQPAGPPGVAVDLEVDLPEIDIPESASDPAVAEASTGPVSLEDLPEGGESEDQEYIAERLTEVEVFVKYGLVDKGLEQLKTVLKRFPRCVQAREKLRDLYSENGDPDRAVGECLHLARILRDKGEGPAAEQVLNDALELGGSPEIQKHVRQALGGEAGAEPVAEAVAEEMPVDLEPAPSPLEAPPSESADLDLDLALDEPQAAGKPEEDGGLELELDLEGSDESAVAEDAPESADEEFQIEIEAPEQTGPSTEEIKEVDFYLEQGLEEEGRALLLKLQERTPGADEIAQRMERLGMKPASAPVAAPAADSGNFLEEIGRELNEEEETAQPVVAPAAAEGGEAEFFDLSSEIDESLFETQTVVEADPGAPMLGEEEHSLEEIFKAFKKGVEQQVEETDFETHYNLGIAYKEMGLIEEAIGEFQIAAKDPQRLVPCCSMLGICFREKGMTNLAVKWYQRGLESPGEDDEVHQGLKYDLAILYMEMEDYARSHELFTDVYGLNAMYRDVSQKMKELEKLIGQEK